MTASYDPALSTDVDWVRSMVGDTDTSGAQLQDEEILQFLTEEANKYLAAALALETMLARWIAQGKGVVEKQVDDLRIRTIINSSSVPAVRDKIKWLRERGAWKLTPGPTSKSRIFSNV